MTNPLPWGRPVTLLAPMEGVSSPGTRQLLASYAPIGLVCTPFIRITDTRPSPEFLRAQVAREKIDNISIQLLGSNAENLAIAAQVLGDAGAKVIDLNFGCPSRQVMRKGVGAALLSQPDTIRRIVAAVRKSVPGLLSAKIRGGIKTLDEGLGIAKAIESEGVDFLTVHPRSSDQGYAGLADWRWTRRLKAELSIPVVGNGDIWYAADAVKLLRWSDCDGLMLGRSSLRNPWIFRQINDCLAGCDISTPSGADLHQHLTELSVRIARDLPSDGPRPLGALKEQAAYLLRTVREPERKPILKAVQTAQSIADLLAAFAEVVAIDELDLASDGPYRLELSAVAWCEDKP